MPDGLRLELLEDKAQTLPVVMHHIHLTTQNGEMARQWYVKTFGAGVGSRRNLPSAMFNGNEVDFLPARMTPAPTKGRAIDHIGFEVKSLESFMKKLQADGVTIDASIDLANEAWDIIARVAVRPARTRRRSLPEHAPRSRP